MKALNHNEGKIRPSLILKDMQYAFKELLKVRENGCIKYDRFNYLLSKGTEHATEFREDNLDSINRHILDVLSGENIDKESRCYHMAHVAIRAMFELQYLEEE